METDLSLLGFILTATGIGLGLWKGKRKFNRTNENGVEQFQSFTGNVVATTFDNFLHWAAIALLFVGLFILAFG